MQYGTGGAPGERPPETVRGMGANLEIIIERQFSGVSRVCGRSLPQPQPMLDAPNTQQNVPAVRSLPDFAG